ncbi:acyl-coenzyme A oxidase 2, peroxisomal [Dorcoceras hygrometricum]|uniref:Acyl-coenzyme A oxidase 2, peroxisomal n=1 Tax=Dorcoceras hygrometricum TaxID=472368 RepID=A0A2Z7BPK0_9LAMI|nr:acyl-coenzyme A oxidase 2, peroxisomal [Dorcoceras hygrometricum]
MKKSAGALSIDDISSYVIIQQEATVISRKIQQMRRDAQDIESAVMTSAVMSSQSAVGNQQMKRSARDEATSRKLFASSRKDPDARKADVAKHCNQAQSIQSTKISAEDEFSRCDKSAAKKLTIYESWMSTAERNSNGESDKTQSRLKMERING